MSTTKKQDTVVSLGAGAAAGVFSTCVVNPLDTLRVRLAASRDATGTSKTLTSHIRALFSAGLADGFGKGLLINLLTSIPSNAVYLSAYRMLNYESTQLGVNHHITPIISAFGAVSITNLSLSPLFVLRTRVQIDASHNFIYYAKNILQHEGARGFYRGTMTNIAGRVVEEATFWYMYESLKRLTDEGKFHRVDATGNQKHATDSVTGFLWASFTVLGLSGVAKLMGTSIAYPYNVVMVHLREVDRVTGKHKHTQVIPTIRHIYRADGLAGFYKGLSPHLMRSVLSKATQLYAFELIMSMCSRV